MRGSSAAMADLPPLGSLVQVIPTIQTVGLGFAGEFGEVVQIGAPPHISLAEVPSATSADQAVLVELHDLGRREWFGMSALCVRGVELDDENASSRHAMRVRIRAAPITESLGYAGLIGEIRGDTRPSISGAGPVIGQDSQDFAVSVWLADLQEQPWFAADLVEPVEDG
jgi:hypothetical protein